MIRTARTTSAAATLGALALGLTVMSSVPAQAEVDHAEGLVAEYVFDQTEGASVPNDAPDSAFGPATVHNALDTDWDDSALTLRGGAKTSSGNWVELPEDLLSDADSATIVTEVKASAAMIGGFHFLWNIGNDSSATEYLFASLNCGSGRSPLVGLKAHGVEELVQAPNCVVSADRWVNVAAVVDGAAGNARLFIDGVQVATGPVSATPADIADQSLNTIGRSPWPDPLFQGAVSTFRVYDQALETAAIEAIAQADADIHADELDAEAQALVDGLEIEDLETSTHIDLPAAGGEVTWTSSNPDVVESDGTVNPPLAGEEPIQVELTATATVRGHSASRTITVTVLPSDESAQDRIERLAQQFVLAPVVASGAQVPPSPAGTSIEIVDVAGDGIEVAETITSTSDEAQEAHISVRVTDDGTSLSVTRDFTVQVLPEDAEDVLAYDRHPTTATEANNADIALSMHLALGDGEDWSPLNDNYGIFFPRTSTTPPASGTTNSIIRSLRDPHLFYLADGDFGIVATRTARGGGPDGTQTSQLLLARSADLRSYTEIGLIDLGVSSGVNQPAAVYDSASERYLVTWTSDSGASMYTTFGDLTTGSDQGPVVRGVVAGIETAVPTGVSGVDDFASGNAVPITDEVAAALRVRFGPVTNTSVAPLEQVSIEAGGELPASDLPARAELGYDDGSTGTRAITWDEDSIAAVDTTTPGTYEVTGRISQPDYPAPFADERADPSIVPFDWNGEQIFLMIATEDLNMNPIDPANGPHMPLRVADRIEDLSDEAVADGRTSEVDLLRAGDTDAAGNTMTGCFWAPEIHLIDDNLSILFMPCYDGSNGRPDMWTGRASIMQLQKDPTGADLDPGDPASWSKPVPVLREDGSILNPIQSISLDMTYFEDSGQSYYAWQMLGAVFIATMDPSDPTRLTSEPVRIVVPEYAWDNTIAEGPNVLVAGDTLYLIYSGSTVGDTYTTGLVTAPAGDGIDLTDPEAWTKLNYPIQKSGPYEDGWQLGTGHGMWSHDEAGNLLYVFHARTDHNGLSGRDTFVRRVHFAADGLPILDMELDEEVAPELRDVTVQVEVTGSATTAPDVSAAVTTRCVVGRVVPVVTVTNNEGVPVTTTVTTDFGSRTITALSGGRSSSLAFTSRQATVPAGSLTIHSTAEIDGETLESEYQVDYEAAACR